MAVKNVAVKKKTKNWYSIIAPTSMNKMFLGESTVYNKTDMQGKTMKLNLFAVTNDIKKQSIDVLFRVSGFEDNNALTQIRGISLTQSYIKRLARRGRNKIDDSFTAKSKDLKLIRIKPIFITNNQTNKSVTSKIRVHAREYLRRMLRGMNYEEFFLDIINLKVQKELRDRLSKVYPLRSVDIRQTLVEKENVIPDPELVEEESSELPESQDEEFVEEESLSESEDQEEAKV